MDECCAEAEKGMKALANIFPNSSVNLGRHVRVPHAEQDNLALLGAPMSRCRYKPAALDVAGVSSRRQIAARNGGVRMIILIGLGTFIYARFRLLTRQTFYALTTGPKPPPP